jgi:peptidoglycan-N-acetylglucosamine deacetylase
MKYQSMRAQFGMRAASIITRLQTYGLVSTYLHRIMGNSDFEGATNNARPIPKHGLRRRLLMISFMLITVVPLSEFLADYACSNHVSPSMALNIMQTPVFNFQTPIPGGTPSPTSIPSPTPTPDLMALRNAAAGCAKGNPPPFPTIITTGNAANKGLPAPREVALTFDDGPSPSSSPGILSILEQTHTPATFFVVGQQATAWPDIVRREWNDGFIIGVHSWDHANMATQSSSQMRQEFSSTITAIHHAIGDNACVWLSRPPYGSFNNTVLQIANSYGLTSINWDDDSNDWSLPGVQRIVSNVLNAARPGAIILMHDGPANRAQTAAAIPLILQGLKARGLAPVTLPQLLYDGHYPMPAAPTPSSAPTPVATPTPIPTACAHPGQCKAPGGGSSDDVP